MTHILSKIFSLPVVALILAFASTACTDEIIYEPEQIVDGETTVGMTVSYFPNVSENVGGNSRSNGNAIETLNSLHVAIFQTDGTLYRLVPQSELVGYSKGTHTDRPSMSPEDSKNNAYWTDGTQDRATFRIENIPNGYYHIYAIANMDIDESDIRVADGDSYTTDEEKLRNIRLSWSENVGENCQMFGYFTNADKMTADTPLEGLAAGDVTINGPSTALHCWLKRAASKVTVAFDPKGLHDDVEIFIHKVTIKDIPRECAIGRDNSPMSASSDAADREKELILDGETLYFNEQGQVTTQNPGDGDDNHFNWMRLDNSIRQTVGTDHSANAQALFFFENMQGDYENEPEDVRERYNKQPKAGWVHQYIDRPESDKDKRPWDYDTKDKINAGSYIEVEAYYNSTNDRNIANGHIIYRFMLGKNVTYNYNAQRNHHYKITLAFNGWANQPEWHIDFTYEKPDLQVPKVFFMPYIYNERVDMPVKWSGDIESIDVQIVDNDWGPYRWDDPKRPVSSGRYAISQEGHPELFLWNTPAWNNHNGLSTATSSMGKSKFYLGFLALAMERDPRPNIIDSYSFAAKDVAHNLLKADYEGSVRGRSRQDLRSFTSEQLADGTYDEFETSTDQKDHYTVSYESGSHTLMLPLFTRAKTMIHSSGFSGNNPYEFLYRRARLKTVAKFKNGAELTEYTDVMQVPRITNPKGVWRKLGDTQNFTVTLMTREGPWDTDNFKPMESVGSWSAEIEAGNDNSNFTIVPGPDSYYEEGSSNYRINGYTNTKVVFDITFNGKEDCAVVLVRYNGKRCIHKIFVRQGYGPMQVEDGGAYWLAYNLKHGGDGKYNNATTTPSPNGALVGNPLSFGSYFKRNNVNQGILEKNNDTYGHLKSINSDNNKPYLELANGGSARWIDITSWWINGWQNIANKAKDMIDTRVWQDIKIGSTTYSLPTYAQFKSLADNANFGYGIFYTDDATETKTEYTEATGYATEWKPGTSTYGMRGIVAYNRNNAHQIFFPLGVAGHGRRHQAFNSYAGRANRGRLLYGDVAGQLTSADDYYRPIPYNLGYSPGALYWIKQIQEDGHVEGDANGNQQYYPCAAWDMNYFSFDFGPYTSNVLWHSTSTTIRTDSGASSMQDRNCEDTGCDALPIRLVRK